MNYQLVYMDKALDDLLGIKEHLSRFYPNTAKRFLDLLEKKAEMLMDNPYIYPEYVHRPAYRKIVVSDYILLYKVNENRKTVAVHRILHGARDIREYL